MKKIILFLVALCISLHASSQVLMGDMNDDNELDISDVTASVNTILGKTAKRYIDAYKVDNTSIVGTWTSTSGSVTFNEDGATDYGSGYTYEYEPHLGRVVFYNSSSVIVKMLDVIKVTANYLVLSPKSSEEYTYYYKGGQVSGITLSETSIAGVIGQTYQLTATVSPADAAIPALIWSSSDENIATVDATGLVTIKTGGIVTITATATDGSGNVAICTITTPIPVSSITLDKTSLTLDLDEDDSYTLTATVLPANADDTSVTWSSSDDDVVMVSSKGKVMAVDYGTATITCTDKDGSGVKATCTITVKKADTKEYVDLGLPSGTLWATCNIGSSSPEEYGDYFAWGETTGYNGGKTTFNLSTYKYCNGSYTTMTKYCTSSSYGTVDNKVELDVTDDAAYVNWGSNWRMPSMTQQDELQTECTWTWTTQNNFNGYKVTGTNGNSIFLPAAGYRYDSSLRDAGSYGYYWTRTLYSDCPIYVCCQGFYSSRVYEDSYYYRYLGQSIRPVLNIATE